MYLLMWRNMWRSEAGMDTARRSSATANGGSGAAAGCCDAAGSAKVRPVYSAATHTRQECKRGAIYGIMEITYKS
jgi:hypothetical protein